MRGRRPGHRQLVDHGVVLDHRLGRERRDRGRLGWERRDRSIVAPTVLASAAMIVNYLGANDERAFTTLVLMTRITAVIPYAFSALAQIKK